MATIPYQPKEVHFVAIEIGESFLLTNYGKWTSSSWETSTEYVGKIIPQSDWVYNNYAGEWHFEERNYYHGLMLGYDIITTVVGVNGPNARWDTLVTVNYLDGTPPPHPAPAAVDDQLTLIQGQTVLASQLVLNDLVPVADKVASIELRPGSGALIPSLEFMHPADNFVISIDPNQWGSQDYKPFIGTATVEYRIFDLLGQSSNWAKISIDYLGENSSRTNILGYDHILQVAYDDAIDFSASNLAVGVHGLGGDDLIRGSQAGDNLNGDDGADRIGGKGGHDIINGGSGNDTLFGDAGNDTLDGGADNDVLWGGEGNDIIRGGLGNDQVYGENGDDQVGGKAGNDAVRGGGGNDTIWGDEGNDALYGDAGNDNINGGAGDDFLTGGIGIDRMRGEAGIDTFVFMRGEAQGDTILDFEGAGIIGGDKIEFRGYGAGATVHLVSGDTWQIDAVGISETFKVAGVTNLAKVDFYFT